MDVNNLLALLFVNAVLELSTPFLFQAKTTLNCFGHTCQQNGQDQRSGKHRRQLRIHCDIDTSGGKPHGSCDHGDGDHHLNTCSNVGPSKCRCYDQSCIDRVSERLIPTVTTQVQTPAVPALQQLDPYTCVAASCSKHEPFCQLFEANNNVEGRCLVIQVGQLCSPANDLSVYGGCYCTDSKCVSNALTDYNQKHTTAATLAQGYMCNKELCRSNMYCHIVNYQGVALSRCLFINALQSCQSYTDVEGEGCICDNTICSINILNEFSLHNPETTTSTTTQSTTSSTIATTLSTKTPTSPSTTPSTTTTTTPTTTPYPTTRTTTTTAIPATTTIGTRTCHICGEMTFQIPCSSRQIGRDLPQTCKTGEDYCMTDIVQDAQGNVDVFKRCVDLATCENKWKKESAGLDYCKDYGVVLNPDAYSCHFCCTQDKCNSMLVPNKTTWYTKTN